MNTSRTSSSRSWRKALSRHFPAVVPSLTRLFWLVMATAHLRALLGEWRAMFVEGVGLEALGGSIILTVSMAFFLLKLLDVPALRFHVDRRSCIAFCMIVALLHLDVIRPTNDPTLVPECTTLVAATWLISLTPAVRRRLPSRLFRTTSLTRHLPSLTRTAETVWQDAIRPHCWHLTYRIFLLRAPPA